MSHVGAPVRLSETGAPGKTVVHAYSVSVWRTLYDPSMMRTVLQIEGTLRNPKAVVESFNILPSD